MAFTKTKGEYAKWTQVQLLIEVHNRQLTVRPSPLELRRVLEEDDKEDEHAAYMKLGSTPAQRDAVRREISLAETRARSAALDRTRKPATSTNPAASDAAIQDAFDQVKQIRSRWVNPMFTKLERSKAKSATTAKMDIISTAGKKIKDLEKKIEDLGKQIRVLNLAVRKETKEMNEKCRVLEDSEGHSLAFFDARIKEEAEVDKELVDKLAILNSLLPSGRPITKFDEIPGEVTPVVEAPSEKVSSSSSSGEKVSSPSVFIEKAGSEPIGTQGFDPKPAQKRPATEIASPAPPSKQQKNEKKNSGNGAPVTPALKKPYSPSAKRPTMSHTDYHSSPLSSMTSAAKPTGLDESSPALPKGTFGKLHFPGGVATPVNFSSGNTWMPKNSAPKPERRKIKEEITKFETRNPDSPRLSKDVFLRFSRQPTRGENNSWIDHPVTQEDFARVKKVADEYSTKSMTLVQSKVYVVFVVRDGDDKEKNMKKAMECWNLLKNAMGKWAYITLFDRTYFEIRGNDYTI